MAAAAVLTILVSCRPETTAGQEEPPAPGPPPAEKSIAPSISIALDSIILYPYGTRLPSCVEFSIKDLSESGEVSVKEQEDLDLSLTYERTTGCGALTILATEAFFEKSKAILVARNGELSDEKEIIVDRAYINVSPQSFSFGPSGGDQRMTVDSNVEYRGECEVGWITIKEENNGEMLISAAENTSDHPRSTEIILSDRNGYLPVTIKVEQAAADHSQEITGERAALEAIYRALHGEDWSDSENWCTDVPLRQWYGVMTNTFKGEAHVVYLHLQYIGAHGQIPSAIGALKYLRELWIIGDPGIEGELPASMANLTELRDLSISGTSVGGPIPECLSALQKLEILGLDNNRFTGNLPLWLGRMSALYNFGFWGNCLDGQIDPSLTETTWWNTLDTRTGNKMGEENLSKGQKEGHGLWL